MKNIHSLFFAVAGAVVFAGLALLTVSLTLAFGTILTLILAIRALSLRTKPVPVRAKANEGQHKPMRVWNDGKGTIIDL